MPALNNPEDEQACESNNKTYRHNDSFHGLSPFWEVLRIETHSVATTGGRRKETTARRLMSPATQLFIDHVEPAQPGVARLELLETDEGYVNSILTVKSFRDEMRLRYGNKRRASPSHRRR